MKKLMEKTHIFDKMGYKEKGNNTGGEAKTHKTPEII